MNCEKSNRCGTSQEESDFRIDIWTGGEVRNVKKNTLWCNHYPNTSQWTTSTDSNGVGCEQNDHFDFKIQYCKVTTGSITWFFRLDKKLRQ